MIKNWSLKIVFTFCHINCPTKKWSAVGHGSRICMAQQTKYAYVYSTRSEVGTLERGLCKSNGFSHESGFAVICTFLFIYNCLQY